MTPGHPYRSAIADWLVTSASVSGNGATRGAIAGRVHVDGRAEYVYPEITGYFLTWAAYAVRTEHRLSSAIAARCDAAVDWLERTTGGGVRLPATRVDPSGRPTADWRNRAAFSFDVAMVLRGLGFHPGAADLLERLAATFERTFVDSEHNIHPFVRVRGGDIPCRWSTTDGPYQAKVAAAILGLPPGVVGDALTGAARRVLASWAVLRERRHTDLHPWLYHGEGLVIGGLVSGDERLLSAAAGVASAVMRLQDDVGSLPAATTPDTDQPRSDVLAQALRLVLSCRALGHDCPDVDPKATDALAAALLFYIEEDGSVRFSGDAADKGTRCVWAAMFAHQALTLLAGDGTRACIEATP